MGVSPPGEDPEFSARCERSGAFVVWFDHQWSDPDATHRWMAGSERSCTVESRLKGNTQSLGCLEIVRYKPIVKEIF
jgi:hypothetical protein